MFLLVQQAAARNIFLTPGDSSSSGVSTFTIDPFSFGTSVGPLTAAFTVLPSSSVNKHYVISRSATDSVATLEGRFPLVTVGTRFSVGGIPAAAALGPDGRYLVVVGNPGVAIVDTTTDRVTSTMGSIEVGGDATDVAMSLDGTRAFVLNPSTLRLTAIDLAARQAAGGLTLPARPTGVVMGPNGILYVSAQSAIYEVDARSLTIRAAIQTSGIPGKLQFTPNGRFALAPVAGAFSGRGASVLNVAARSVSDIPNANFGLIDVAVVSDSLAYGITSTGVVYTLSIASDGVVSATLSAFQGGGVPAGVTEIAASGEFPSARHLVLGTAGFLYRLEVGTNEATTGTLKPAVGNLTLVTPPSQGGAFGHNIYGNGQTVAAGTTSQPLVVRVWDQNGLPASGVPVVFSISSGGMTLTSATSTSNLEGLAFTSVSVPASLTSGTATVTANIQNGARSASFTVTVGNPNLPGGGTGTNPNVRTGLNIVSGHGHAVSANFATNPGALRVRLTDNAGNPVSGQAITWELVRGGGNIQGGRVTNTDANGEAFNTFVASGFNPGIPWQLNIITATAPSGQRVELYVVALPRLEQGPGSIDPAWPTEQVITMKAGEVKPGAIQVRAFVTGSSNPAPYIGLRIVNPAQAVDPSIPSITCRGDIVLTDLNGLASCDVVAPATVGDYNVTVILGEIFSRTFLIRVTQGDPANIEQVGGNGQSGILGQILAPMTVRVTDVAGNPLPNVSVNWEVPFFMGISSIQRTTDANGRSQAVLILPTDRAGTFNIRVVAGNVSTTFTATALVQTAGIERVAGNDQIATVGQAFAQQLQVRVLDAQRRGIPDATVNFSVSSGSASLSTGSARTNADGVASVTVTAGQTAGAVIVTASAGSQVTSFNLTVRLAGPVFGPDSFLNAAGFNVGISPGGIAYIRAAGVASGIRGSVTPPTIVGPLPTRLADVEVLFNNIPAPIYAVSNVNNEESVVVQVPFEVAPGSATVTIRSAGGGSTTVAGIPILPLKPGVFTFADTSGQTYAVATRPDGSYISAANPARRGEEIRVYATGLGQTSPGTGTNRAGTGGQQVSAATIGGINNAGVRVRSAELLVGAVGVYVVTMEIPLDTQTGNLQPLGLGVTGGDGQTIFANAAYIPII